MYLGIDNPVKVKINFSKKFPADLSDGKKQRSLNEVDDEARYNKSHKKRNMK